MSIYRIEDVVNWDDYKEYVKTVNPEMGRDIAQMECLAHIITMIINQRNSLGLSQRELASMCGLPQSSVARIESCKTNPKLNTLLNILNHLGLEITITPIKSQQ